MSITESTKMKEKIPVILHTDIGTDIDDTWALIMMLRQPRLRPMMILTDTGDTAYRGAICAKLLKIADRSEIEIGLGLPSSHPEYVKTQAEWVADFSPEQFKGTIYNDGIERMIERIMNSEQPVTLISIAPCTSIAEALSREPRIAGKVNFVGMFGSIERQLDGKPGAIAEYNVMRDIPACRKVFSSPWRSMVITPLDTCGIVRLRGELYRRIAEADDPLLQALMENFQIWRKFHNWQAENVSSILFDTVAVHLASSRKFLKTVQMNLIPDQNGYMHMDSASGNSVEVAIDWMDLEGYQEFLVNTLTHI